MQLARLFFLLQISELFLQSLLVLTAHSQNRFPNTTSTNFILNM